MLSVPNWFIASNAHATSATAGTKTAFLLGDTEVDQFTGSSQNDLIISGGGTDILQGNPGNDTLYGGTGIDDDECHRLFKLAA
ncbi:MAG: hypothetical protein Q7J84_01670 [Sulfuricaulis sp.]|nr:hypothetical protein [Sulfuricaulis sp.]